MSIFTKIFSNRESEKFGWSWVETYGRHYERAVRKSPHAAPIVHLICMWDGHFAPLPRKYLPERSLKLLMDPVVENFACLHACIPPPDCAIALGLFMLSIEQPQVVARHPKFEEEYGRLMAAVLPLQKQEDFDGLNALFNKQNPNATKQSPFPIGGMEDCQRGKSLGLW